MQTEENEFWLYLSQISEQVVKQFVKAFEQKHNVKIEVNRVDREDAFFKQEGNVVVAELGEIPHWQLVLSTPSRSIAYEAYRLCKNQGWNACLFDPKAEAVFVSFEELEL